MGQITGQLALARLKPRIGLIDHIDSTFATDKTAVLVASLHGLERINNFHDICSEWNPSFSTSGAGLKTGNAVNSIA